MTLLHEPCNLRNMGQIDHLFIGMRKTVTWKERTFETAYFKEEVYGPVSTNGFSLQGDDQVESVHGGEHKAVYVYPKEHYAWWKSTQPKLDFPWGIFGENIVASDFTDADVCVGDLFQCGSAVLEATQPRMPCFKLGMRFNNPSMIATFLKSKKYGVYFRIEKPGVIRPGDRLERTLRGTGAVSIFEVSDFLETKIVSNETKEKLLGIPTLDPRVRKKLLAS